MLSYRFLEKAQCGLLITLGGEQEVNGLPRLIDGAIKIFPLALELILIRGQNETNDPWPSRQASQPLSVSAQAR